MLLANKLQIWGDGVVPCMTLKQMLLLIFISEIGKQSPTITEVADFTGTSRQNVKKMLIPLEKKGYINTRKSETDARAMSVSLTEKAFAYFADNNDKSAKALNVLFSILADNELIITKQAIDKILVSVGNLNSEVF